MRGEQTTSGTMRMEAGNGGRRQLAGRLTRPRKLMPEWLDSDISHVREVE